MSNIMGGSDSSSAQTPSSRDPLIGLSGRLISVRLDMVQSSEGIVPVSRHRLKSKMDRSGHCASSVGMARIEGQARAGCKGATSGGDRLGHARLVQPQLSNLFSNASSAGIRPARGLLFRRVVPLLVFPSSIDRSIDR
jgi:hypothetical protein